MVQKLLIQTITIFFFLFSIAAFSQTYPLSPSSKVSILTCGSGEQLHSIFGHTAIRIQDQNRNIDVVYNFGMFDFSTPNFYLKFVKGDMQYFVANSSFEQFMYGYRLENRSVYQQELNFTTGQKQHIFDELNKILISEERFYTYKFIDKNCTTMVVDKVNKELGNPLIQKIGNREESYRDILNPYLTNLFYEKLGINIIFGYRTDEKAEQLFLPVELMNSLEKLQINQKQLVNTTETLFEQDTSLLSASWWNTIYTFLFILLIIALCQNNKVYLSFLMLLGLLGLFLSLVGLYSLHREVLNNYNVLLFNPFLLGIVYFYSKKNKVWFNRLASVILVNFLIYIVILLNKAHLLEMMAILLTITFILFKLRKKLENELLTSKEKYST